MKNHGSDKTTKRFEKEKQEKCIRGDTEKSNEGDGMERDGWNEEDKDKR